MQVCADVLVAQPVVACKAVGGRELEELASVYGVSGSTAAQSLLLMIMLCHIAISMSLAAFTQWSPSTPAMLA